MKLGSNIAVNNVLQVYVTTTTVFYAISLRKVRTSHTITGAGMSNYKETFKIIRGGSLGNLSFAKSIYLILHLLILSHQ